MFLVILSHCKPTNGWYLFYNPFFISGFYFVSGLFFLNQDKKVSAQQKLMNIFTSLILPYFAYWTLSYGVEHIISGDYLFLNSLLVSIIEGKKLWFISVLIVSELIAYLYLWVLKDKYSKIRMYSFPIVSIIVYYLLPIIDYPWYFRTAFLANFFFGIGVICKYHRRIAGQLLNSYKIGFVGIALFVLMMVIDGLFIHQSGSFNGLYHSYIFFIIESYVAVYAIMWFLKIYLPDNKALTFVGRNSLLYYFLQHQIVLMLFRLASKVEFAGDQWWSCFFYAVLVCVILYPVVTIVNKYVPVLSGRFRIRI